MSIKSFKSQKRAVIWFFVYQKLKKVNQNKIIK